MRDSAQSYRPHLRRLQIFSCSILLSAAVIACSKPQEAPNQSVTNSNLLAYGDSAKAQVAVPVTIQESENLNGINVEQLISRRNDLTSRVPELFQHPYSAFPPLFSKIDTNLHWESLTSYYYQGAASFCGDGPSLDSVEILNPLLLVSARIFGLSSSYGGFAWDKTKATVEQSALNSFPLFIKPTELTYFPKVSRAEVSYNVSKYIQDVSGYLIKNLSSGDIRLSFAAINAVDMGFNVVKVASIPKQAMSFRKDFVGPSMLLDHFEPRQLKASSESCNSGWYPRNMFYGVAINSLPTTFDITLSTSANPQNVKKPPFLFRILFK